MTVMIKTTVFITSIIISIIVAGVAGYYIGLSSGGMPLTQTIATQTIYHTTTETYTHALITTYTYTLTTKPTPETLTTPSREEMLKPIIEAAKKEGKLVIYSVLDRPSAEPLLNAFKAKYPFIDIEYVELGGPSVYKRYLQEKAAGAPTADILLSTSADLQYMLILQGSALPYRLTTYDNLPERVKYREMAYIPYYVLIAPIYNTQKIPKELAPKSYADVLKLLTTRTDLFPPKSIAVFDIEKNALALVFTYYLYKGDPVLTESLFKATGKIGYLLYSASGPQIEVVGKGEAVLALTLVSNYAYIQSKTNPNIGVFVPNDIAVLQPAIVFITKEAQHPNAAKLMLEFIMSEEGQNFLAKGDLVPSVVDNPYTPQYSLSYLMNYIKKPIIVRLGDGIIDELLKDDVRKSFIQMWKNWLGAG